MNQQMPYKQVKDYTTTIYNRTTFSICKSIVVSLPAKHKYVSVAVAEKYNRRLKYCVSFHINKQAQELRLLYENLMDKH
jgi:hypothetical protein